MESGSQNIMDRILQSVDDIPPMPQIVIKAQELLADPNSSPMEIANLLESDQSIATQVLKMANSAFYGMSGKISSLQHASLVLGYKTLAEIITMAGVKKMLEKKLPGYGFESQDLWRHSISVGLGSKIIAQKKNPELEAVAHTSGLIHDVGKLILDHFVLEEKEAFDEFLQDEHQTFLQAEKQILGFDHAEVAAEMCKRWNIPTDVSVAIRYHHAPSGSQGVKLAYILHMADHLAIMSGDGYESDDVLYELEEGTMDILGIQQSDVSGLAFEILDSASNVLS